MIDPSTFDAPRSKKPRDNPSGSSAGPCSLSEQEMSRLLREHCDVLEPIVRLLVDTHSPLNRTLAEAIGRLLRAGDDPLRSAFLSRSCNAIARMSAALPAQTLGEVVGELSDYRVLLHALEEPETLGALEEDDPLASARLRGLEVRAELLKSEGGVLSVNEVATRLGISRQAVDKRRRARHLLALPMGKSRHLYPAWQFTEDGVLPGLEQVLQAFQDEAPWSQAAFFLGENTILDGKRPLDELRRGDLAGVRRAAALLGEQVAA
jgi:hypothetical protein